jgi:hypothetical protein
VSARLRLVVNARWSIALDVFFVISSVLCTTLTVDNRSKVFPAKKKIC